MQIYAGLKKSLICMCILIHRYHHSADADWLFMMLLVGVFAVMRRFGWNSWSWPPRAEAVVMVTRVPWRSCWESRCLRSALRDLLRLRTISVCRSLRRRWVRRRPERGRRSQHTSFIYSHKNTEPRALALTTSAFRVVFESAVKSQCLRSCFICL